MWDPRSVLPPPRWRLNRLQVVAIAHAKGIGPSEPAKGSVDHGKFEEVRRQRLPHRQHHDEGHEAARQILLRPDHYLQNATGFDISLDVLNLRRPYGRKRDYDPEAGSQLLGGRTVM
jgi:hypothetical protein